MPPERGVSLSQRVSQEQERVRMDEALAALRARGALRDDGCPECHTSNWNVDFLAIPSVPLPEVANIPPNVVRHVGITSASSYIPALTLVCINCGYFKIFNLNILGMTGGR